MGDTKRTRRSRHNRPGAHMDSQRLRQRAQGLHRCAPDGVLELKDKWTDAPSLTQKKFPIYNHLQNENFVFFHRKQTTLTGRLRAQQ